ncbi:replication protein, partial [Lactiplantibacillus plantarum]
MAKNKHVYAKTDIVYLNDFDIDRYVKLNENQKRELKNLLLNIIRKEHLVNVIHLLDFIEVHGAE